MRIDGKIVGGYVLLCDCGEAFALERIGISIECPACGHTELGPEVALEYYLRSQTGRGADKDALSSAASSAALA